MKNKALRSVLLATGLIAAVFASGCGTNLPCDTDPSQVDSVRTELKKSEAALASVKSDLSDVTNDKSDLEKKLRSLPDAAELESDLDLLKKGSGRF